MKLKLLLPLLFIMPYLTNAQSFYLVGTSQVSIEPAQSLISLNMTGYGFPRDGRFTLQWEKRGAVPEVNAMGSLNGKLYIVTSGDLLVMNPTKNSPVWEKVGKAENIRSIAGFRDVLFAINNQGKLLRTKVNRGNLWEALESEENLVTVIAATKNKLYATKADGSLYYADFYGNRVEWRKVETLTNILNNIVCLAANEQKLYVLTNDEVIYQCTPGRADSKWLKIAYRNGETIKEDIKQIAVAGERLFGISKDNILYQGEHRTEGNLSSRAMAIKNGQSTVVIVNVDICGLTDAFTGLIKKEISLKDHIPPQAVFINCTHTHFAPVSQDCLTWQEHSQRPDSSFLYSTVKSGIINSVENALKAMTPAEMFFGRGSTEIGFNRSLPDHPELYDNAVDVIRVNYTGTNSASYLFLTACHPVFSTAGKLNYTLSANYPGVSRKLIEERTGTSNSLFIQGTAGDIDPKDNGEYITGEKLSNEVIAVLGKPMTKISGPISCYLDTIDIPVKPWTKEEITAYRADNIGKVGDVYAEKNVKWCDLMFKYYREGTMPQSMPVYINTLNVGNWKLVGFSRETTTGYGLTVKNFWPDKLISVAGYTNDVSSYLPTHMHLEAGVYEGKDSYFWDGMPNAFPKDADKTILNKIKSLER